MGEELGDVLHKEISDYYQLTKGGNVWEYDVEDLLTLLTTRAYKSLPFEVSEVIFRCLGHYHYVHKQYKKTGHITKSEWRAVLWDYGTKQRVTYRYKTIPELPITQLPDEVYTDFFKYYSLGLVDNYFDRVMPMELYIISRGNRVEYTSPIENYKPMTNRLSETVYYYLGKKKTDKILQEYDVRYLERYKESWYYDKHTHVDRKTVKLGFEREYRLMRNRTRLNTGEPILEND